MAHRRNEPCKGAENPPIEEYQCNMQTANSGMRLYFCKSEVAGSRYISLSVFHDVFGGTYTKPLYIEKNEKAAGLAGRCYERRFGGRDFYSLIKDPRGVYRHNATLYRDALEWTPFLRQPVNP